MSETSEIVDPSCAVCRRRLLPGERANPYVTGEGEEVTVCELCKPRAEAGGWLRPDEAATRGSSGGRRRRQRGQLLSGLRKRVDREREDAEEFEELEPPQRERTREVADEAPAEPGAEAREPRRRKRGPGDDAREGEQRDRESGRHLEDTPGRSRPARPTRSAAGPDLLEALTAFNESDLRRTVAGLQRSLGEPRATGIAVRTASGDNGARITVAWELAWYQWEIGPGRRRPEIRELAKGETVDQLRASDRNWNLIVARDGTLARRGSAEEPVEEPAGDPA